jgi:hypothetical protein
MRLYKISYNKNYNILIYSRSGSIRLLTVIDKLYKKNCFIIKVTCKFKIITYEELLEEKYSGYGFWYGDKETLEYNIEIMNKLGISYLNKIVDIKYLHKIKIKK